MSEQLPEHEQTQQTDHLPAVTKESEYAAQARQEIDNWMNPEKGMVAKALQALNTPIDEAGDALMDSPEYGEAIKGATEKVLAALSDAANWSIDKQAVLDAYKKKTNKPMAVLTDIYALPLKTADEQVKTLKTKYAALTSAQGVATGVVGWAGIPADIVGLLTANLRAIGEYATHYGFDLSDKGEQLYAISLLAIATSQSAKERQGTLK